MTTDSPIKITEKIVGFAVVDTAKEAAVAQAAPAPVAAAKGPAIVTMNETLRRPDVLIGSTYKIKSPNLDHAMYVTINDLVLNAGTDHEQRQPFEVFINSKAMDQFQWIVALTRILSAVFRKGGDITFLVEEMKAVFDPKGGYFKPGGVYMPSVIAEIGTILEQHLMGVGLMAKPEMSQETKDLIASKRAQIDAVSAATHAVDASKGGFPPNATMCGKCHAKAQIIMDGCATCLNCGASKCG